MFRDYFPGSLRKQICVVVAMVLVLLVAVILYDIRFAARSDDTLLAAIERRVSDTAFYLREGVAAEVGRKLAEDPAAGMEVILEESFDEVAAPIVAGQKGVRLCMFVVENERIFIRGSLHEYKKLSAEAQQKREERVYNEALLGIEAVIGGGKPLSRMGRTWDDCFYEHLVPLYVGDRLVAVVWAEERIHPIFAQSAKIRLMVRYTVLAVFFGVILGAAVIITTLTNRISQIQKGVAQLETDLTAPLPDMPGELGQITDSLNKMARGLAEKEMILEKLRRSECLAALGRLVTNIAHELKNPAGVIEVTVQLIEEEYKKKVPGLGEYIKVIRNQLRRHHELVQELVDFSRPNSCQLKQLSVNRLLQEVLSFSEPLRKKYNIELVLNLAKALPGIQGDSERLKRVFSNLITNAIEAMPSGGTLSVSSKVTNGYVEVAVQDTGFGIAAEDIPHIFELFYTTKAGGTGLGLALTKQIVEMHGGQITAESKKQGATFKVYLPVSTD